MNATANEYRSLLDGTAIAAPFRSRLEILGTDRAAWLHNMCTADIKALAMGQSCEAFVTNVKGHVLAHVLVVAASDRLLIYSLADDLPPLVPQFDRYIIREDVTLAETSSEPGPWLAAEGALADHQALSNTTAFGKPLAVYDGLDTASREAVAGSLLPAISAEACQLLCIAAGWPVHGVDFSDSALPQELSRTAEAISFTKGCYLGQETVARLDALGHVNKQLARVQLTSDAPPELPLQLAVDEKPAGTLTSVAPSPNGDGWIGLAMVRREFAEQGRELGTDLESVVVVP